MKFKGVIFDLDGTILNTLQDLADSVNCALEQYGLPPHETDAYRLMIGRGFANLIETAIAASIRKMQASAAAEELSAQNETGGNASADEPYFPKEEIKPVLTDVAGVESLPAPEEAVSLEKAMMPKDAEDPLAGIISNSMRGHFRDADAGFVTDEDILPSGRMTEEEKQVLQRGVLEAFTDEYSRRYHRTTAPYPGIQAMLSHVSDAGIRIAVNSNKRDDYTNYLISRNFPDLEWTCVLGGREDIPKKPDPAGPRLIAEKMNLHPKMVRVYENARNIAADTNPFESEEPKKGFLAGLFSRRKEGDGERKLLFTEMAYVGDSNVDMQTAKNAGMTAVGVAWGFRGRQELEESGADFIAEDPLQLQEYLLSDR